MASQTYLLRRPSGLHFRIRVPEDLWAVFGRREIRRSLARLTARQARPEALLMANRAREFFDWVRMARKNHSDSELQSIADQWMHRGLQEDVTAYRVARRKGQPPPDRNLQDPEVLDTLSLVVSEDIDVIRFGSPRQAKEAYDRWEPTAREVATCAGIDFLELSEDEQERLIRLTMVAQSRRFSLLRDHSPDFPVDFWCSAVESARPIAPTDSPKTDAPSTSACPTLSEAWGLCLKNYQDAGQRAWQITDESGRPRKNRHAEWFRDDLFEFWGPERPLSAISWEDVEDLRTCFQRKYPAGRNRKPTYRGRSLREIFEGPDIPPDDRIRGSSKDSKFRLARQFFTFLRANPRTSPFFPHDVETVLKVAPDAQESYEPWTLDEIKRILESDQVHSRFLRRNQNHHPAGMFWLLAMLAYTGARQQEIMGLRPEDVVIDTEHPVIHIREHEHRPSIKTEFSVRWVPIHRDLLQMGLADWIRFRQRYRQPTLWPLSNRGSHFWADRFREDITKPLGLHKPRRKVMHSFRGTFDSLAANHMPTEMRRLVTGHTDRGTDYRSYLRQLDTFVPVYSEHLNRIQLGLDLERLENLWRTSIQS